MNLRDFISEALTEIYKGVEDATKKVPGICPALTRIAKHPGEFSLRQVGGRPQAFQFVEFDVAISATKDESGKAAIGVVSFGLGAGVDTKTVREESSRVRFKLPLVLPADIAGE